MEEYSEFIERQEQAAQLEKQERLIELKKYLNETCDNNDCSTLSIIVRTNLTEVFTGGCFLLFAEELKDFDEETIEQLCERLEIPEHIRKDFRLPEYYYRYTVSI